MQTEPLPPHPRYAWQKQLQKSLFGEIQLAVDTETGMQVAVKLSQTSRLDARDDTVVEDPRLEISLINYVNKNCTHENVVQILDSFTFEDYECAVLPLCSNGDLFERVGTLSSDDSFSAFLQIVNGLSHIHHQGIAHLDISLENVLIDAHGMLKICDFGLARKYSDPCSRVGKLFYMAPEVVYPDLQGDNYDCRMGDLYSLGVCLFILYTGFQPYEAPTQKCKSFIVLIQHGVRGLLQGYGVLHKLPEKVVVLLEVLLCPLQKRVNIESLVTLLDEMNPDEDVDDFFNSDQNFNVSDFSFN